MVVGLSAGVRKPFDGRPLEAASFSVDDVDCPDMELGFATPKKQRLSSKRQRQKRVSFAATATRNLIPNTGDISEEEKAEAYFSTMELQLIRVELRTTIIRTNQELMESGAEQLTPEQEETLRGLEVYIEPGKSATANRRYQAKQVVVYQEHNNADWIATKYREVTATASEIARKLALVDEQRAWPVGDDETQQTNGELSNSSQHAPMYQIMIR